MILPPEAWMDLRRLKPLRDAGATWKVIADELGLDPRTVKKYLNGPAVPPTAPRRIGTQPRLIEHLAPVVTFAASSIFSVTGPSHVSSVGPQRCQASAASSHCCRVVDLHWTGSNVMAPSYRRAPDLSDGV